MLNQARHNQGQDWRWLPEPKPKLCVTLGKT
jgi:hypothetical protein